MAEPTVIIKGDAPTFRFAITEPTSGDPFALINYGATFFIKRSVQDSDAAAEFRGALDSGISIPFDLADGVLDVTVPKTVTANLRLGRLYPWWLVLTNTLDPTKVYTPLRGTFLVTLATTD